MNRFVERLMIRPKALFLIDSAGALTTAFFLFGILRTFNRYVGMPQSTLTYLAIVAVAFCMYSMTCYFFVGDNWRPFLSAISIANLTYCVLTISLAVYFYDSLTSLGLTYFLIEVIAVGGLVFLELKVLAITGKSSKLTLVDGTK